MRVASILSAFLGLGLSVGVAHAELTASDVKRVMAQHRGEVSECYERFAKNQSSATGKVTLDIGVDENGVVDSLEVDAPGVKGDRFPRCVDRKVKQWKFPEPGKGGTVVQIPYKFHYTDPGHS